jgi:HEAT repeat protein
MKSNLFFALTFTSFLTFSPLARGQDQPAANQPDAKQRARAARELVKQGQDGVPSLQRYVTDTDLGVRLEAVKALDDIGGPKTVDALVLAARDPDPEIQIRATDGLVNVYLPGYLKTGISGTLQRAGNSVKAKFTDTNDQVIDAYVEVRPEAIGALGHLAAAGASVESRANACRALGILRGGAAIPDLVQALHSKDNQTMYEGLIALQKIRDVSAGPRAAFLLHDLEEKIQLTAIETAGLLGNREAQPDLRDVLDHTHSAKVRRAATASLAMLAVAPDHALFQKSLSDNDDAIRAAGAEGLGRLKDPADRAALDKAFNAEHKLNTRLSIAFALVSLGNLDMGEFSPFRYLINTLNLRSYRGVALSFLTELARDMTVRQALYPLLPRATKDEKIQLGIVLSRSGEKDSLPYLETLQMDPDPEVAQESIRSLRALRARLP